jgi:hypothetical protein
LQLGFFFSKLTLTSNLALDHANYCRFAVISGNQLPLSVNLSTQSGKEKLAYLLLHTLYPHQQR